MKISAQLIKEIQSHYLEYAQGSLSATGSTPLPPECAKPGSLIYVSSPDQLKTALEIPAGIIVCLKKILKESIELKADQALFLTPAIPAAMALINPLFDTKKSRWPMGIHPSAHISPSAKLGDNVTVSINCVIGDEVIIGENTFIGPNSVVEKGAQIGSSTYLHPSVFIGANCIIGNHCEIHPHTTIGSDGFGYAKDPQTGIAHKIPQLGIVVLEDHVELGANCAIDRATLTETRICSGTKLDNLVHIAHNCVLGKNGFYTAGFMTAGSSEIGANFACGGGVVVADHIKITDNVTLGGRSAVTKDVTESGAYTGYPLEPWREGLRTLANLPNVSEMRKQISEIRKHLGLDKDSP
ncbi:MAG: UDP-3-O-acylglucosamine N-acyltransferase [Oligoflexia bacterium]|nr:MAG: UDP-3-O-acylglucosamine N-acyltransferase [Oligoflexia bacterium]